MMYDFFIVVYTVERLFVIFVLSHRESPREESVPRLRLSLAPLLFDAFYS